MNDRRLYDFCIIMLIIACLFSGCKFFDGDSDSSQADVTYETTQSQSQKKDASLKQDAKKDNSKKDESKEDESETKSDDEEDSYDIYADGHSFLENNVPDYSGSPYCLVNDNVPNFPEDDKNDTEFEITLTFRNALIPYLQTEVFVVNVYKKGD